MSSDGILTLSRLQELTVNRIYLLGLDWDGTLYNHEAEPPYNTYEAALNLTMAIAQKGIVICLLTARDASLKTRLVPILREATRNSFKNHPFYISGANGGNLLEIANGEVKLLYSFGLSDTQIEKIIKAFQQLNLKREELSSRSVSIFNMFVDRGLAYWRDYINPDLFVISKQYKGKIWIEKSKVSLALPEGEREVEVFNKLKSLLKDEEDLNFKLAGDAFCHVGSTLTVAGEPIDGKRYAVEFIMDKLKISENNLGTFGDQPEKNDEGLLSFPYSFTNNQNFSGNPPPYLLSGGGVKSVYDALGYLIG